MPLADSTAVVNLALDMLGEPFIDDLDAAPAPNGEAFRLHYSQAMEATLEAHNWSFATRSVYLVTADAFTPPAEEGDEPFYYEPGDWFEPDVSEWPVVSQFGTTFVLPADCLRITNLSTADIDIPLNRFEVQGRYLLLPDTDAPEPILRYVTKNPPVDEWPSGFTDAVAFLLASRLAPRLAQDPNMANTMLQKHEMALGRARNTDARQTRSKENHGPRALAARSGLVNSRYSFNALPPY